MSSTLDTPAAQPATAPGADLTETASRLRLAVNRMARRLRQEAGGELGPASVSALASIERRGPLTPSELAEIEGVRRPTATRLLGRLCEEGYVSRTQDPDDGRSAIVDITPEGRKILNRLRKRKTAYLAKRMKDLPESELAILASATEILERMLEGGRR
jgi:DNA-binding MarR family transcriptional regulator